MSLQVESIERRESRAGAMFRALSHRNFRLLWGGAFLSNIGTWMSMVAQGWLVLKLTDSAFWLGLDGFMATLPGLLLTLVGGVFADLVDRKRLLMYSQVGAGLSALALALLVMTNVVEVWMVLVLSFTTGCCMALSGPSFQAITIDLVGREDLANAIALHSTQFQFSRVIGPAIAGVAIKFFGLAGCFFLNALSYVAIFAALMRVRVERKGSDDASATAHPVRDRRALWRDLVDGFRYVGTRPRVRLLLIASAVVSLFGAPYLVMMPLYARDVFGWGETGLSVMMGTAGAGAFLGALLVAYLGDFRRKSLFMLGAAFSGGACLVGFALAGRPFVSLALLFGVGFSMVGFFAVANMLLQQLVQDEMRGRVMSMWILALIGTMPVGSFISGLAAERLGVQWTLATGGFIILAFVLLIGFGNQRSRAAE